MKKQELKQSEDRLIQRENTLSILSNTSIKKLSMKFSVFLIAFLFMLGMTKIVLTYKNGTGKKISRKASLEDPESEVVGFFDILIPQTFAVLIAVTTATAMSFFVPVFRNPLNILTWSTLFAYICVALPKPRKI